MTIEPGQRLGSYRILADLGRGAMGEVHHALDERLGRPVALKFLPPHLAADAERLHRFEREARLLAALNHPGVAQIHGFEQHGDQRFLVLEYVDGETLEQRLRGGALPLTTALDLGAQIAAALAAAHAAGVVHRDLKPANIRITPDGRAKVLDFGLAKLVDRSGSGVHATLNLTATGRVLGTPAYMAPEQLRGQKVGPAVDVWSFGCVLYECVTGQRAFRGSTLSEVVHAVFEHEPDGRALAVAPAPLRALVRGCLDRDPTRRGQDLGAVRQALQRIAATPAHAATGRRRWAAVGALGLAVAAGLGYALRARPTPAPRPAAQRLSIAAPAATAHLSEPQLSADARVVLFRGSDADGATALFVRRLDSFATERLPGTDGASAPFLAPDGAHIGFRRGDALLCVPTAGGPVRELCRGVNARDAVWLTDRSIVWSCAESGGLWRLPDGGAPTPLTTPAADELRHTGPRPLPGDARVLFTAWERRPDGGAAAWAAVLDLDTGTWRRVVRGAGARFVAPDHLVLLGDGGYQTLAFDPETATARGQPVPVHEELPRPRDDDGAQSLHVSAGGSLVFVPPAPDDGEVRLVLDWGAELQGAGALDPQ
ncbi:MAG: protein kinase [Planctomycetota bacterium]